MESRTKLALAAVGLSALGAACLIIGMVGTYTQVTPVLIQGENGEMLAQYRSEADYGPSAQRYAFVRRNREMAATQENARARTELVTKPSGAFLSALAAERREAATSTTKRTPIRDKTALRKRAGLKPKKNGQQLKLEFAGDTPLNDDDFDAAGYNMEGVWDWKLGKFRSPKFVHEPEIEGYEDPEDGSTLDIPGCEADPNLPVVTLFDDCGEWPHYEWRHEYHEKCCGWCWWGCYRWRREYVPMEMPDAGGHDLPMGYYSTLGDECYDDRPINVVKDRTKNEAAWMGGCLLPGCVSPNTCSAVSIPDGVNLQLFSEPNFMGYTISLQGPNEIPCLVNWGWNDRIQSVKVQNSIGLDSDVPLPIDRIHGTDWIYPDGPDSSMSKYDPYFNQWDELDSTPHEWRPLAEGMDGDGVDTVTPEAWQADINNLY